VLTQSSGKEAGTKMSEPGVEVLVLTKGEIESLINRKDVTDAVETAFRALGVKVRLI